MLKPLMPYIDYALNYDYISTQLCENKSKPEMNCHGKCHLTKEIKKVKDQEERDPAMPNFKNINEDYYIPASNLSSIVSYKKDKKKIISYFQSALAIGYTHKILHPPQI